MGGFKEYDQYDGLGLAELIKKREVSPAEICEEAITRIERVNPTLNAVITPMYELARKAVQNNLPDGPFSGVPFLLKDLLGDFAGVPQTMGSKACKNYIPSRDSELVKRYKQAGLVILGKTNTPEFGLKGITEPELHGPTRNPWNADHTPGGSSGGSAAAVASGMVPLASANDGAGSIRIPAACCGLFGLKVTRGRTPNGPIHGRTWQGAVVEHVISRSVRDSAAILDATQGADVGARQTGGVQGADDSADTGAGDDTRLHFQLIEDFEHGDVREPLGATATQRQTDTRLRLQQPLTTARQQ